MFETFYSPMPYCTPARAGLLTGRWPIRTGLTQVVFPEGHPIDSLQRLAGGPVRLPADEITLAEALRVAGYQTAVTELAFLRHRMANGTCGGDSDRRHAELLATLHRARAAAVNAPGALGLAANRPARRRPGRPQSTG